MSTLRILVACALLPLLSGCATLGTIGIQAPRFDLAEGRSSELRLVGPSAQRPLGGAAVRLWARVENPNPVGITLASLAGTLSLEGIDAATADFPLGLPLTASADTIIPLDLIVSFAELPGLAEILPGAVTRGQVDYQLRGVTRVDAGVLGQPSFGPMTLLEGTLQAR